MGAVLQSKEKSMRQENKINGSGNRVDIYTKITGRIVAALEEGVRPWVQPWRTDVSRAASRGHCVTLVSRIPASMFCCCGASVCPAASNRQPG
jgi:hypothetical protein